MTGSVPTPRDSEAKLQHILLYSAQIFAEQGFEGAYIRDFTSVSASKISVY
jgi:hypothetical protein